MYIVIAGAGLVGRQLSKQLTRHHHDVVAVDIDRNVCEELYAETGALTVNGSATDLSVLEEAGMDKADVALALMHSDADNLAFCLLARQFGVKRIMDQIRRPEYQEAYEAAGATTVVEVTNLVVHRLFTAVEQPRVRRLASLGSGQAEIVLLTIPARARVARKTIEQIAQDRTFPTDCVFAGIFRPDQNEFIVPRGNERILVGDHVFLAAAAPDISRATEYLLQG
jgi:trk system potassium uptake protein TrkA